MSLIDIATGGLSENIPTKGYSQAQIAKKIGVSFNYKYHPTPRLIQLIKTLRVI
jgi:hypothetical protein